MLIRTAMKFGLDRWKHQCGSGFAADSLGYTPEPFKFYFDSGINTIRFNSQAEPLVIGEIRIYQVPQLKPYAEVYQSYQELGYLPTKNIVIEIQGEEAVYKSDPTLFGVFDQGDPTMKPYHPVQIRINSIGGHRWALANQWITWKFEVPESGLYKIAIKGKQNQLRGFMPTAVFILTVRSLFKN